MQRDGHHESSRPPRVEQKEARSLDGAEAGDTLDGGARPPTDHGGPEFLIM